MRRGVPQRRQSCRRQELGYTVLIVAGFWSWRDLTSHSPLSPNDKSCVPYYSSVRSPFAPNEPTSACLLGHARLPEGHRGENIRVPCAAHLTGACQWAAPFYPFFCWEIQTPITHDAALASRRATDLDFLPLTTAWAGFSSSG